MAPIMLPTPPLFMISSMELESMDMLEMRLSTRSCACSLRPADCRVFISSAMFPPIIFEISFDTTRVTRSFCFLFCFVDHNN
jgi:hypothetical protein